MLTGVLGGAPASERWFELTVIGVGVLAVVVASLAAFAYRYRRRRVFTHGLRGTALVIDVRSTPMMRRRNGPLERGSDVVTVATAARPRGIRCEQQVPMREYWVGQVVPVVQAPGQPDRLYLDRPDLERSALGVWGYLAVPLAAPLIVFLGLRGG